MLKNFIFFYILKDSLFYWFFENLNISTKNIISVEAANVLGYPLA
jgi:hypothetical protein